jgi:hypothetical protein
LVTLPTPTLDDVWGEKFEALYFKYEQSGVARKVIKAQKLWYAILESQTETGTPYMLYKDACNRKSNQQNRGTIKCSNLCTEIVEYTSPDEVAVCNLASVSLPAFVHKDAAGVVTFDFAKLADVVKVATRNLDKIIDVNYYPVKQAENSNMRHRPIGLGKQLQSLSDRCAGVGRRIYQDENSVRITRSAKTQQRHLRMYVLCRPHRVVRDCKGQRHLFELCGLACLQRRLATGHVGG